MAAHQAPPSLGFSRQEHWRGLPFPSPVHESEVAELCPTHSDPMDCSLPGSSVHGILQARILEWGAIAFSRAIQEANIKRPEFPKGFQGRCSKGRVISLSTVLWLIDTKVIGVLGLMSSVLRLQPVWVLCAHGHHAVNFFHLMRVLISAEQLCNAHQPVICVLQGGTKESVTLYGWFIN